MGSSKQKRSQKGKLQGDTWNTKRKDEISNLKANRYVDLNHKGNGSIIVLFLGRVHKFIYHFRVSVVLQNLGTPIVQDTSEGYEC